MSTLAAAGFALSPLQQRLWQLAEEDGHATYRVEQAFRPADGITAADLRRAFAQVLQAHPVLRTAWLRVPGMALPLQAPDNDDASPLAQIVPLDATRWLLRLPALCGDAETASMVLAALARQLAGAPPERQDALPFVDMAQWQHEMLADAAGEPLVHWPASLAQRLPFMRRSSAASPAPTRHLLATPPELGQRIDMLAASIRSTPCDILLAAWSALLARLHGEPLPLMVRSDGRGYDELAAVAGPLARWLPLPAPASTLAAFADWLGEVAARREKATSLQDGLPPLPPGARGGTGFAWSEGSPMEGGLIVPCMPFEWCERMPLLLRAHRDATGALTLAFDHDVAACEPGAVDRLEEEFLTLLDAALLAPRQPVQALPVLGQRERALVLEQMQGPCVPDATPWQAVHAQALARLQQAGSAVAVADDDRTLGGTAFVARVDAIAAQLLAAGVGRGAIVGLLLPRNVDLVAGILAIQRAGGAYLPLDAAYPPQRLATMLADSGAKVLLSSAALLADARLLPPTQDLTVVHIDALAAEPALGLEPTTWPTMAPDDLAYVIYTSGSTGAPKGVRVSHGNLANQLAWLTRELPMTAADVLLQKTPVSFDASVWELYAPLLSGARLVTAPPGAERDPDLLLATMQRHSVTVLQIVPSLLRMLVDHPALRQCTSLRRLCCGGEALDADLARRALALGVELINLYGPTECTVQVVAGAVQADDAVVAIGRPIANTRIYILDPDREPVPLGMRGEIWISGAAVAEGYHAQPDLTAARFRPDPFVAVPGARMYRSGDVGAWWPDGRLECFGRGDRQVKLRSYRVELGEIEALAAAQPGVALAAAIVDRDASGIDQLLCFCCAHPGVALDAAALKQALAARLPDAMTPNWVVAVERFPMTPSGKIDVPALVRLRPAEAPTSRPPRDAIELRLERIWGAVLNVGRAGVDSSFFDLGGHSLLAVRLMAEIEKEFGHRLPLTSLFTAPTIAAQALLLRGEAVRIDPVVVPIRSGAAGRSPLVLVHPTGGSVLCYRELARGLRTDRPVVALQDPGLGGEAAYASVEELAALYLQRIAPLVADGRYLLAGWSSGGVIAYEIACQALERGHEVALLCLIDSRMTRVADEPVSPDPDRLVRSISRLIAHKAALDAPELSGLPLDAALDALLSFAQRADFLPADAGRSDIKRLFRVFERNVDVIGRYQARRLPRRTLVMKATEQLPEGLREAAVRPVGEDLLLRWEQLCFARVHDIPADHLSIMEPPRLHGVLEALHAELAEVDRLHALPRHNLHPMLGL